MQTISILNKVELALRRQSSVRDRFEVSGVESRDRGGRRRDNLPQRLDIKSPEILGTRIKTLGGDGCRNSRGCLREMENIFLREQKLVLVVNEDRTRIDGSDSEQSATLQHPWPPLLICSQCQRLGVYLWPYWYWFIIAPTSIQGK